MVRSIRYFHMLPVNRLYRGLKTGESMKDIQWLCNH
jgi:hypothetical protein